MVLTILILREIKVLADIKSNIDFPKYQIFPMIFDRSNSDV